MKIGVGIITCNRPEMFKKLYESIPFDKIHELVIVNDGKEIEKTVPFGHVINHSTNIGVGESKNEALRDLINSKCDFIFLIEDDMVIKNPEIFNEYIKYSKKTGIHHFLFGYHGPANKLNNISGGEPHPRVVVDYGDDIKVALNLHCVGAFCMYTRSSLNCVGLFDEEFKNAFEHVHHSYMLCQKGFCTEYWWWPDVHNSYDFIEEQACSEHSSAIRPRADWQSNIQTGFKVFQKKTGYSPVEVPNLDFETVKKKLKDLALN